MGTGRKYVVAVVLLAVLAVVFGVAGTVAPPLAEEAKPSESSSSSSSSVAHFTSPPSYDSGWVDIRYKAGQYFNFTHYLNSTEVVVDIMGMKDVALQWNKTYGGPRREVAYSMLQTDDTGYAIAGYTYKSGSPSYPNLYFVKTDASGNMQWSRTYLEEKNGVVKSAVQTGDGGYALAGYIGPIAGPFDFWLAKTDPSGNLQWNKTYGKTSNDYAYSVVQTTDGGYALAGYTGSYGAGLFDMWLVKTDSSGSVQWNKTYGGTNWDYAYSMVQTIDGGYALTGYTQSYGAGSNDFWLVRTDSSGNALWNKTYGGTSNDEAYSVVQTSDGGYAIAGHTGSFGSGYQVYLVKMFADGTMAWNKTYGGTNYDYGRSVVQTVDGGYAIAGYTNSFGSGYKGYLVKTDASGTMACNKTFGGTSNDYAYSLVQTSDKGYALAGETNSYGAGGDFWLVKVLSEDHWERFEHQRNFSTDSGLTFTRLTNTTITLYRGATDIYWDYVRVRMWVIKEPSWIYGDINMDGAVDAKDLYIVGRNYGKTFSLLSVSGIIAIAGIHTIKKRKQAN